MLGALSLCPAVSAGPGTQRLHIQLPTQNLSDALLQLAKQGRFTMAAAAGLLKPHTAPALEGHYPIDQALSILLAGSGLSFHWVGANRLVISPSKITPTAKPAPALAKPTSAQTLFRPIEEVRVTAQRHNQNLQQVPIAVSVSDKHQIERANLVKLDEIAQRTPGLTISNYSLGQPSIHLRGVGSNDDGAAMDASTVLFVDDVYVGRISTIDLGVLDVERVEVLRGPQGTLYGKNAIGGAIKLVGIEPSAENSGQLRLGFGNYHSQQARLTLNGSLDQQQQWLGRVLLDHQQRDGWQHNLIDRGDKQMGERKHSVRSKLAYRPDSNWQLRWSFDASRDDLNSTGRIPVAGRVPLKLIDNSQAPQTATEIFTELGGDYRHATNDLRGYTDRFIWGGSQKIDWQRPGLTLNSISAYRHSQFDWLEDSAGLPASRTLQTVDLNVRESYRQYSQEFRAHWRINDSLQLLSGLHFMREDIRRQELYFFTGAQARSKQFNRSDSAALYGELQWALGERDHISLGGRLSYDKKTLQQIASNGGAPAIILQDFEVQSHNSWQDFSPRLTWRHQLHPEFMFYASLAKGIKSGGFQGVPGTLASAQQVIGPESAWETQLGFKTLWRDKLRLNISAFVTDYSDLQVSQFRTIDSFGVFETSNAASAKLSGLELEFVYSPLAQLSLSGSYAYLNARYKRFDASNGQNYKGNRLRQAPQHSFNLALDYQQRLQQGQLQWHLGLQYQGESYREPDNSITIHPSFTLLDGKLSYQADNAQWQLSLWGKNLADRAYISHLYVIGGNDYALFGTPRTWGLSLHYKL
ncbi:MAG: TonB-dependent receptor [Cellvibrionaceae bacterium]|nr:TonB-dependent receptor [Cellvibrionaceae bacterium]